MIFDEEFLGKEIEAKWGKHGAHAEVYRMLMARSVEGWIPVSERLPANTNHVLVAYMPAVRAPEGRVQGRHWSITVCRYSGGAWRFVIPSQKSRLSKRVKFWQPIPSAPRSAAIL